MFTNNRPDFTDPTGDVWTPEDIREMWTAELPFQIYGRPSQGRFASTFAKSIKKHRLLRGNHLDIRNETVTTKLCGGPLVKQFGGVT